MKEGVTAREILARNPFFVLGQKVSSREPFYTKTHLKYFKILYPPRYFIKPKLKLLVDFYNIEIFIKL